MLLWYVTAPFRALTPLFRESSLRRVAAVPWVLTLIVIALSLRFGISEISQLVHDVIQLSGVWAVLAAAVLTIMLVVSFVYLFVVLLAIISAPFNEALSDRAEQYFRPDDTPEGYTAEERRNRRNRTGRVRLFLRVYLYAIRTEILRLVIFGLIMLVLFVASWWSGGLLFVLLNGVVSLFFLVYEFLEYPMERYEYTFGQKLTFMRKHALPLAAYGVGLAAFLLIPGLNLCFIPVAVISGTEVFLRHAPR